MAKQKTIKVDDAAMCSLSSDHFTSLTDIAKAKGVSDSSNAHNLNVKVICGFLPFSNSWLYHQVLKSTMPDLIVRTWTHKNE